MKTICSGKWFGFPFDKSKNFKDIVIYLQIIWCDDKTKERINNMNTEVYRLK